MNKEEVELVPIWAPAYVIYLAGFTEIHHLSSPEAVAYYADFQKGFEFSSWSNDSENEDVYTNVASLEVNAPPEILAASDDIDGQIRILKECLTKIKGDPKPQHGGTLQFGLLEPAYRSAGSTRMMVLVTEHWTRSARLKRR